MMTSNKLQTTMILGN